LLLHVARCVDRRADNAHLPLRSIACATQGER
jgi:hypothetical protein